MVAVRVVIVVLLAALVTGASCEGTPVTAPKEGCAAEADAVFWGGTQWVELAQGLGADASDCVEYYVTVPPQDSDRSTLREAAEFDKVRGAGPRIHPVAEIRFTGETGWREWALEERQSFYEAGAEARRRMDEAGLDVETGETWAFNELSPEVLADDPGWREDVLEFMRGLHDGTAGMPKARGIVFNIFIPSDTADLAGYKASLKAWLEDEAFWTELEKYVDFFAEEVYPSPSTWGVTGASLDERRGYTQDYLFHMLELVKAAPDDSVAAAREFLLTAYLPLANAAWPHEGIGQTNLISAEAMSAFVSAQVEAISEYPGARREDGRVKIGFAWAPNEAEASYSESGRDLILERMAAALRAGYQEDGDPCRDDACSADVDGASFNEAWKTFATWD